MLTKAPLRLPYQAVEGKGPTEGFTSLIKDEVKTGGSTQSTGRLIYLWGCDDSSGSHRGVTLYYEYIVDL